MFIFFPSKPQGKFLMSIKLGTRLLQDLSQFYFGWPTINKNVTWINYIYYNQQRFANYTRNIIKGLAKQLGPTSNMAWENQIALDMILAAKGGVCIMIGSQHCTFITIIPSWMGL
jgi:hypothetical protein